MMVKTFAARVVSVITHVNQGWLHYQRQHQSGGLSFPVEVNVEGWGFEPHIRVLKGMLKNGTLVLGQGKLPVEGCVPVRYEA